MTDLYLDHVLIAVRDLTQTASTFRGLGFTVTPEGVHRGRGTHNRLVVFGPEYLELISIRDASEGLFRPNMAPFLESREGLFMFAMGTQEIGARHLDLRRQGIAIKDPVDGARHPQGGAAGYSWRQAEIDSGETPGCQTFFIQHNQTVEERYVEPPEPTRHANGVKGIHYLALAVHDAEAAAARWQQVFGFATVSTEESPAEHARRLRLDLRNAYLDFLSPTQPGPLSEFLDRYGEAPYELGLHVEDLSATAAYLRQQGVSAADPTSLDGKPTLVLDPKHAQGVPLRLTGG